MRIGRRSFSPAIVGWTIIGVSAAGIASLVVGASLGVAVYGIPVATSFALALLHSAAIPLALIRPVVGVIASVIAVPLLSIGAVGASNAPWPWSVSSIVTQSIVVFLVAVQARARVGVAAWLAVVASTIVVWLAFPRDADASAVNTIVAAAVMAMAFGIGVGCREWRSIWDQLVRERAVSAAEHERRVVAEEKTRIARELHDVVAHNMSIINMRASTAVYRFADVPTPLVAEFDDIAAEARNALVELRRLLGVLRAEDAGRELAPQPVLADIPRLVEATKRSGAEITFIWDVAFSDTVADLVSLAAYRIVQESISNALRHATGAAISVACSRNSDILTITVTNTPPPIAVDPGKSSHGMAGMRERAAAVGGTFGAAPTLDGGYMVRAALPLAAREAIQ